MNFPQTPNLLLFSMAKAARTALPSPLTNHLPTGIKSQKQKKRVWENSFSRRFLHTTRFARASTAWNSTCVPASASSGSMLSASLCESPSLQGVKIIAVGTLRAT